MESSVTAVINETAEKLIAKRRELIKEINEIDDYLQMVAQRFGFKMPTEMEKPPHLPKRGKFKMIVSTERLEKSIRINYSDRSQTVISLKSLYAVLKIIKKQIPNKAHFVFVSDIARDADVSETTTGIALKLMEFKGIIKREGKYITLIKKKPKTQSTSDTVPAVDVETPEAKAKIEELEKSPEERRKEIQRQRQSLK